MSRKQHSAVQKRYTLIPWLISDWPGSPTYLVYRCRGDSSACFEWSREKRIPSVSRALTARVATWTASSGCISAASAGPQWCPPSATTVSRSDSTAEAHSTSLLQSSAEACMPEPDRKTVQCNFNTGIRLKRTIHQRMLRTAQMSPLRGAPDTILT